MALSVNAAKAEIRKLTDPDYEHFGGFPATKAEAAERWSGVCRAYFEGHLAIPPGLFPLLPDALEEMHGDAYDACLDVMAAFVPDALVNIPLGFQAYAVTFAEAIQVALIAAYPTTGPAIVTPPAAVFVMPTATTSDGEAAALAIATVVDAWAKTGSYIPPHSAPPGPPPPVFWS